MAKIEEKIVSRLCSISETLPVDWAAFDAVLDSIPDINVIEEDVWEETYLSSCIENISAYHSGEVLADLIRHFLAQGYDVRANEGKNGGLCLSQLCWSSYDRYIIDAAKVLVLAGAPINYPSEDDEPDEPGEIPDGVIGGTRDLDEEETEAEEELAYKEVFYAETTAGDLFNMQKDTIAVDDLLTAFNAEKVNKSADGKKLTFMSDGYGFAVTLSDPDTISKDDDAVIVSEEHFGDIK